MVWEKQRLSRVQLVVFGYPRYSGRFVRFLLLRHFLFKFYLAERIAGRHDTMPTHAVLENYVTQRTSITLPYTYKSCLKGGGRGRRKGRIIYTYIIYTCISKQVAEIKKTLQADS